MSPRRKVVRRSKFASLHAFVKAVPPQYIATLAISIFMGCQGTKLNQVEDKVTQTAVSQAAALDDANASMVRLAALERLVAAQGQELRRLGGRVERGRRRTNALEVEAARPQHGIVSKLLGWISSPFKAKEG